MAQDDPKTLVSTDWLASHMRDPDLRILDASMYMPGSDRNARAEYAEGHIPGAINIPYDRIGAQLGSLEDYRERDLVVYCRTGRRAGVAEEVLSKAGFEQIWDLEGHMVAWRDANLPVGVPAADCC